MGAKVLLLALLGVAFFSLVERSQGQRIADDSATPAGRSAMVNKYCVGCHSDRLRTAGFSLEKADLQNASSKAEQWEKVVRKLRVGAMPPQGSPRPEAALMSGLAASIENELDASARKTLNPGRVSMHRLNRAEYTNAVRDLLALQIDGTALLPAHDESSGFDNIADVLRMSPALMERYLSASYNISRLAVGNLKIAPATSVYRVRPDLSQDQHLEGQTRD